MRLKQHHARRLALRTIIRAAVAGRRDAGPTLAACSPIDRAIIIFSPFRAAFWAHPIREEFLTERRGCPIAVAYLAYLARKSAHGR
jgi:hypothetical protein